MKKLIIAVIFAVVSTATFAQTKKETTTTTTTTTTTEHTAKLHCYFMKEGAMQECWGTKGVPMTKEATLKNGTTVSTKGEIAEKNGKKVALKNGECILADNGTIGAFDKLHAKNHKMH